MKTTTKILSITAMFALTVSTFLPQTFAQLANDSGTTSLVLNGNNGAFSVSTFDIDFWSGTTSSAQQNKVGVIVGNGGYIKITDEKAIDTWYATIDLTTLDAGSGKTIPDVNAAMTNDGDITTLAWVATTEIQSVLQQNVNFAGAGGFTIAMRDDVSSAAIGTYGLIPDFNLNIPAYTLQGSYQGAVEVTIFQL
jgi:hypothetical protein